MVLGAARPRGGPSGHASGRKAWQDKRGHFLLVSGILVTMGFMVFASTIVTMSSWEDRTHREQRYSLVDEVGEIVFVLEQTLEAMHRPGQMNRTVFQEAAVATQAELERNAARSGLIAQVRLAQDVDLSFVQREGRCLGVDPDASVEGAVYGWNLVTLKKGIVGAVYEIHVTDGRQTMRVDHYVKLDECATNEIFTHALRWSGPVGRVENLSAAQVDDDKAMELVEELDWDNLVAMSVHPVINQSSIVIYNNWNQPNHLLKLDGTYTVMSSNQNALPDNNCHRFMVDPPERMREGDTLPNVTLEITGYKDLATTVDQTMWLYVYNDQPMGSQCPWEDPWIMEPFDLPVGKDQADTIQIVLEEFHPGSGEWTYQDIVDSRWELKLMGDHQPSQKWNIDHFNMTGSMMVAQAYRLNVTFEWPEIPGIYEEHSLHLRYRIDPATLDEGFLLQARDVDGYVEGGEWWELYNMTDTGGAWVSVDLDVFAGVDPPPLPDSSKRLEFRAWDTDHYDNWEPEDEDRVQVELFRMISCFSAPCPSS